MGTNLFLIGHYLVTNWSLTSIKFDKKGLHHGSPNTGSTDVVPVEGGRFEVRLQDRQLLDRYSAVPGAADSAKRIAPGATGREYHKIGNMRKQGYILYVFDCSYICRLSIPIMDSTTVGWRPKAAGPLL